MMPENGTKVVELVVPRIATEPLLGVVMSIKGDFLSGVEVRYQIDGLPMITKVESSADGKFSFNDLGNTSGRLSFSLDGFRLRRLNYVPSMNGTLKIALSRVGPYDLAVTDSTGRAIHCDELKMRSAGGLVKTTKKVNGRYHFDLVEDEATIVSILISGLWHRTEVLDRGDVGEAQVPFHSQQKFRLSEALLQGLGDLRLSIQSTDLCKIDRWFSRDQFRNGLMIDLLPGSYSVQLFGRKGRNLKALLVSQELEVPKVATKTLLLTGN
jgi:hypothetical protein